MSWAPKSIAGWPISSPGANLTHIWHDQQLEAGNRWDDEIRGALREMNVFVCLVSYEFLASDYVMQVELKESLRQEKKKEVAIVPILLHSVNLGQRLPRTEGV
jgi:hypothetical protein